MNLTLPRNLIERFCSSGEMTSILGGYLLKESSIRKQFHRLLKHPEIPETMILVLDAENVIEAVCKFYRISKGEILVSRIGNENL